MKDILLVMSDQHNGCMTSKADTPFLDKWKKSSTVFQHAYTTCPLCVPARSSFLTGRYPHELGIFDNDTALSSNEPTIAHVLGSAGYRTVLAGRMHFKGYDQYHGFDERYVGDITTQFWGTGRNDLHAFQGTLQASGCQKEYGYGDSPVLAYDEAVVKQAVSILQKSDDRPLLLVIGLYAPHFPYVCPEEMFRKYDRRNQDSSDYRDPVDPWYQAMCQKTDQETVRQIRSAYCGMIENIDRQVGQIYQAWQKRQENCSERGIFIYTSDHGDQAGRRGLFGKKTLYEDSVRIPLIIEDGVHKNVIEENEVSLLDLTRTIADWGGAHLPLGRGENLFQERGKPVRIQTILEDNERPFFLEALISRRKKFVQSGGTAKLFDLRSDPSEEVDCLTQYIEDIEEWKQYLLGYEEIGRLEQQYLEAKSKHQIMTGWGKSRQLSEPWRYRIPEASARKPRKITAEK